MDSKEINLEDRIRIELYKQMYIISENDTCYKKLYCYDHKLQTLVSSKVFQNRNPSLHNITKNLNCNFSIFEAEIQFEEQLDTNEIIHFLLKNNNTELVAINEKGNIAPFFITGFSFRIEENYPKINELEIDGRLQSDAIKIDEIAKSSFLNALEKESNLNEVLLKYYKITKN